MLAQTFIFGIIPFEYIPQMYSCDRKLCSEWIQMLLRMTCFCARNFKNIFLLYQFHPHPNYNGHSSRGSAGATPTLWDEDRRNVLNANISIDSIRSLWAHPEPQGTWHDFYWILSECVTDCLTLRWSKERGKRDSPYFPDFHISGFRLTGWAVVWRTPHQEDMEPRKKGPIQWNF